MFSGGIERGQWHEMGQRIFRSQMFFSVFFYLNAFWLLSCGCRICFDLVFKFRKKVLNKFKQINFYSP